MFNSLLILFVLLIKRIIVLPRSRLKGRSFKKRIFNILFVIIILFSNEFKDIIILIKTKGLNCFKVIINKVKGLGRVINLLKILIMKLLLNVF